MLLILPHQDDEIFCYSLLDKSSGVIILFKGGGESKNEPHFSEEDLHIKRCTESMMVCDEMGVGYLNFVAIQRPYKMDTLGAWAETFFSNFSDDRIIITTMKEDNHEDHKVLQDVILKYSNNPVYGFIVHTDTQIEYAKKHKPDIEIKLNDEQYKHKLELGDYYQTQRHFLPNVLKRGAYRTEKFWRLK